MNQPTPATELRAAADKIRKLAGQATGSPWETTWRGQEYHLDGYRGGDLHPVSEWTYAIATREPQAAEQRAECDTADADFIAAMHPGVALALADWLGSCADLHEPNVCAKHEGCDPLGCQWCADEDTPCADTRHALAVARAILARPVAVEGSGSTR